MRALTAFRDTRRRTLEIVDRLSQTQMDWQPGPEKWSVGEVLDHLVRVDELFAGEYEELLRRGHRDGCGLLFRGISSTGLSLPLVPRSLLPLFDLPAAVLGVVVPRPVRQLVLGNRAVPAQAPPPIRPRSGRRADDLRRELERALERVEALFRDHPDLRLERLWYYNPLTGFTDLPGTVSFTASHESRHQEQLAEILSSPGFPS